MFVVSQAQSGNTDMLPMESKRYVEEHTAILALARKGRTEFVGHDD